MIGKTLVTFISLVAAGSLLASEAQPLTYRFDEVKSKVMKAPGGDEKQEVRVAAGDSALGGDHVRTGFWGNTVVSVSERSSRFEIGSSTRVKLQGDEPGVLLILEKGRLKAIFDALTGGQQMERKVAAPGALLAVRGTRYGLEVGDDGETLLAVFEGTVEVFPSAPGFAPVRVQRDQFCTFGPKAAPRPRPMGERGMSEQSWGRKQAGGPQGGPDGRPGGPNDPGKGSQPGGMDPRGQAPGGGPGSMPGQGPAPGQGSGGGPSKPRTE